MCEVTLHHIMLKNSTKNSEVVWKLKSRLEKIYLFLVTPSIKSLLFSDPDYN